MESRELNLAYCAGVMDSEGCLSVSPYSIKGTDKIRYHCDLFIGMQNLHCLNFIQKTVGAGTITKRKDCWMLQATGPKASHILKLLIPYMVVKKQAAEIFQEFAATFVKGNVKPITTSVANLRQELSEQIRQYNKADAKAFYNNGVNSVNLLPNESK